MKRLLSCLGIVSLFTSAALVHAASFSDVPNDSPTQRYTDYLLDQEIISNNPQFFPARTITRAELAKMATNAGIKFDVLAQSGGSAQHFCDVSANHWASSYINILGEAHIVSGTSTNTCSLGKQFLPDQPITRAEAIKILLNLFQITPSGSTSFRDVDSNLWYSSYIAAAVQAGIVNGYSDGTFKPNNFLTRADMSKVLVLAIDHHTGENHRMRVLPTNEPLATTHPTATQTPTPTSHPTTTTTTSSTISAGAINIYALGDSLTAGDRDETDQQGYTSRLLTRINTFRPGSQMHDIGVSGVDISTLASNQLPQALAARPQVVTLLIGSNDMWQDGWNDTDTSAGTIQNYRENMDSILAQLHAAGIRVYVGLVDDQSQRPVAQGSGMGLNDAQRARMSRIATAFNQIIQEKAAQYGATPVDFYHTTIFTSSATLSDDDNHPNAAGYDAMASVWFSAMRSAL